ncbi:MAG: flagellar basal body rod protein FlgC [Alphaproteobacteria bacterium]|nr:flagellar basal body rod protein FlgC [Alphaproteobacteria bacterium]OJV46334.1 MAG: flagellar basal body rod protein FlgC [Alphaproteobacteria bacterium 43-37]
MAGSSSVSSSVSNLRKAQVSAAAAMHAQTVRLRVLSENVAHGDSTSPAPGVDPYRRKTVSFKNVFDRDLGMDLIVVDNVGRDKSELHKVHRPNDPGADEQGFVKKTNVNTLIEMMDVREATQSHDANLKVYQSANSMQTQTIDALKGS